MDNQRFMIEVENSHNRSKKLLIKKEKEYSSGQDRLGQFYRAGSVEAVTPHSALIGMATKHYTSVVDMAKKPLDFTIAQWDSKITDLRNYTYLLDALVRDFKERVPGAVVMEE
jgi:hypothetical protein